LCGIRLGKCQGGQAVRGLQGLPWVMGFPYRPNYIIYVIVSETIFEADFKSLNGLAIASKLID
jgi:hypothetical protein